MPRSNRPRGSKKKPEAEELNLDNLRRGVSRTEIKRGVEYTTQTSIGANADDDKTWVCPHCHMQIVKGVSHMVAWDAERGPDTRRHFHNACWKSFQGPLL